MTLFGFGQEKRMSKDDLPRIKKNAPLPENHDPRYAWVWREQGPRILREALHLHGTIEFPGEQNNPLILEWAKEVDPRHDDWLGGWYTEDSTPWCGLYVGICARRAGFPHNQKLLAAKEWANWGEPVLTPMLGDVLVFTREGGGHVGFYIGEDDTAFHVLGGNQSDAVNIKRISKKRLFAARRCDWKISQPSNVRAVKLAANGKLSENEA